MKIIAVLPGVLAIFMLNTAQAGSVALTFTGGTQVDINIDTVVGWRFTANNAILVDSLGMYDTEGDGFNTPSDVGLWDINGVLLASATVSSGDTLVSGFRFSAITPIQLNVGQDYVVAGTLNGDIDGDNYFSDAASSTISSVTWVGSRATNESALTFPTNFLTNTDGWFGANFTVVIPEPSSLALAGLGLSFLAMQRKR